MTATRRRRRQTTSILASACLLVSGLGIAAVTASGVGAQSPSPTATGSFTSVCPVLGDGTPWAADPALRRVNSPKQLAVDDAGNVYFHDSGNDFADGGVRGAILRRVDAVTGAVTLVAGVGPVTNRDVDGIAAADAWLAEPQGLTVTPDGTSLYFIESARVRRIDLVSGVISTVAGVRGDLSIGADTGPALTTPLGDATDVVVRGTDLFVLTFGTNADPVTRAGRIFRIDLANGTTTKIAGTTIDAAGFQEGAPALQVPRPATDVFWNAQANLGLDRATGDLFFSGAFGSLFRYDAATGEMRWFAGVGVNGSRASGIPALTANILTSSAYAVRGTDLFVAELATGGRISRIDLGTNVVTTYVESTFGAGFGGDGEPVGPSTRLSVPFDLAFDAAGDLFVSDTLNHRIRRISAAGQVDTIAGAPDNPVMGALFGNESEPISLQTIGGLAADDAGGLYVADSLANRIYYADPNGGLRTFAGNGRRRIAVPGPVFPFAGTAATGYSLGGELDNAGQGGLGALRFASTPAGRFLYAFEAASGDGSGRIVRFSVDDTVRAVEPVIGQDGVGEVTSGTLASTQPGLFTDFAVAPNGDVYVAARRRGWVYRIDATTGVVTDFAGTGSLTPFDPQTAGDDRLVTSLGLVTSLDVDDDGRVYLVASGSVVLRIDPATGVVEHIAGAPNPGGSIGGTGGPALAATLVPTSIKVDSSGRVFLAESNMVRAFTPGGVLEQVAGGTVADDIEHTASGVSRPVDDARIGFAVDLDIAVDGSVVFADHFRTGTDLQLPGGLPVNRVGSHRVRALRVGSCDRRLPLAPSTTANTQLLSGALSGTKRVYEVAATDDLRYIAFSADGTPSLGGRQGQINAYLYDRLTGRRQLVNLGGDGQPDNVGLPPNDPTVDIAMRGQFPVVAFPSNATNLTTGGANELYVRFTESGLTSPVRNGGALINGPQVAPSLSPDGRLLVFRNLASALDPRPGLLYLADVGDLAAAVRPIGRASGGGVPNGIFDNARIADASGHVVYQTTATNLGPPSGGVAQIVREDLTDGSKELVSIDVFGNAGAGNSDDPYISADGRYVAFVSDAANLGAVPQGSPLVRDLATGITTNLLDLPDAPSTTGRIRAMSPDGRRFLLDLVRLGSRRAYILDRSGSTPSWTELEPVRSDPLESPNGPAPFAFQSSGAIDAGGRRAVFVSHHGITTPNSKEIPQLFLVDSHRVDRSGPYTADRQLVSLGNQLVGRIVRRQPDGSVLAVGGSLSVITATSSTVRVNERFRNPTGMVLAPDGRVFVGDEQGAWRVDLDGTVTQLLAAPVPVDGLALAPDGRVAVSLRDDTVARVEADGSRTVIAGRSFFPTCTANDGDLATATAFCRIGPIAYDRDGNLFIADSGLRGNNRGAILVGGCVAGECSDRIRRVDARSGRVSTVAGLAGPAALSRGYEEDGVAAVSTTLGHVSDLVVGADGSLVIAQPDENRVRRIDANGVITTIVGNGGTGPTPPNLSALAGFTAPMTADVGPNGELAVADIVGRVYEVAGLDVTLSVSAAVSRPGVAAAPTAAIPAVAIDPPPTETNETTLGATGFGQVGDDPIAQGRLNASPLRTIPLRTIPLRTIAMSASPLRTIPLRTIPLRTIPLLLPGGWEEALKGTSLEGVPIDALTLADAFGPANTNLETHNGRDLLDQPLSVLDLSATPLRTIALAAVALGALPLRTIPLATPTTANDAAWCQVVELALGQTCAQAQIDPATDSLFAINLAGVPLRTIPLRTIPLRTIEIESTPLRTIPLRTINLDASPLRTIPLRTIPLRTIATTAAPLRTIPLRTIPLRTIELDASPLRTIPLRTIANVATLVDCAKVSCTATGSTLATATDADAILATASVGALTEALPAGVLDQFQIGDVRIYGDATIEDLLDLLPTEPEYTLDDLLKALVPLTDYPWETLDLGETAELRAAATTLPNGDPATPPAPVTYTVDVVRGTTAIDMAVDVDIVPPFGFRFVPGSARRRRGTDALALPVPTVSASGLRFRVAGLRQADQLTFDFVPGLELGARQTSVTVSGVNVPLARTASLATSVAGEWEEPNDTLVTARPMTADTIYLGHIATGTDVDTFKLTVQEGQSLSLILSNLGADLDLTLYAPLAPLVNTRSTERVLVPVADEGVTLDGAPVAAPADVANDVPLEAGVAVYTVAQRRGTADERIDTGRLHAGTYYLKVTGFNGAATTKAYALRAAVLAAAPGLPTCSAWSYTTATTERGALPPTATLAAANTLFLVNRERLFGRFGTAEGARVMAALDTFVSAAATHPAWGVRAAVVPVDGDDAVHAANLAWDSTEGRCDPNRARALSAAIAGRVDQIRAAVPGVTNVVIIGGDDLVPFGRVADTTKLANEREYESQIAGVNEISAAMRAGWMLTDDVYVDAEPVVVGASELSVPTATVGRLVESPSDIVNALADFTTNDGHLDARTALSVGYDFLADGASAVRDALVVNGLVTDAGATDLVSDTWTAARLRQALLGSAVAPVPDIASVNAHYDHFRALPADQNLSGLQTDLFDLTDVTASGARTLARSLLFSMGCHSGLSVADDSVAGFKADWAQTYTAEGAVWLGNTGFGYGDTEVVAASEKLMLLFARQLDGSVTAGQALLAAKQRYVGDLGETVTPYDLKVAQEMTYYGLPMYRLRAAAAPLDPAPIPPATAVDVRTQLDTATLTITAPLTQTIGDRGTYWTVAGDALTVQNRPIQPRTTVDVTRVDAAGATVADARGMLVTSLVSTDRAVDPVIFRPIIDSSEETEPATVENVFPAAPVSIGRYADLVTVNGSATLIDRQQVVAIPGQFQSTGTTGVQRLYSSIGGLVYYASPADTDLTAPTIRHVAAAVNGSGASFTVTTDDAGVAAGVRRVFVLAVPAGAPSGSTSVWVGADLVRGGTTTDAAVWSGGVVVPAGTTSVDYIVQVVDASGNVAISSNKGVNYTTATAPTADPQAPVVTTSPAVAPGAWLGTAATVTATDPQSSSMAYRVDGGIFQAYTGPFAVTGSGVHEIVVRNALGRSTTVIVPIDADAPRVTCASAPTTWSATPVSIACVAADGASGLADPADAGFALVAPAPPGTETATASTNSRQVCDRVARCVTAGPITGVRIDTRGPVVTVTTPAANATFAVGQAVTASYGCIDGGSGLASCAGPVASGAPLDTATAGAKTFAVTGRDALGNTTTRTVTYTVRAANSAPVVRADLGIVGLEDVGFQSNAVALTGSFTDAEGNGPFRADVQWQAGGAFVPFVLTSGSQWATAFVYGSAGTRVVTVRVCDAANNCGTGTVTVRTTITQRVTPVLECVRDRGTTVSPRYLARFGYDNPAPFFVALAGTANAFSPTPVLRGQPLVFRPGRQQFVFDVAFNGSNLTWNLNGRSVTANASSRRCTS